MNCHSTVISLFALTDVRTMANDIHDEIHEKCDREDDEHRTRMHVESHGHSHNHDVSGSVASVAWMVIMGDGFHNFCDGIAIGKLNYLVVGFRTQLDSEVSCDIHGMD